MEEGINKAETRNKEGRPFVVRGTRPEFCNTDCLLWYKSMGSRSQGVFVAFFNDHTRSLPIVNQDVPGDAFLWLNTRPPWELFCEGYVGRFCSQTPSCAEHTSTENTSEQKFRAWQDEDDYLSISASLSKRAEPLPAPQPSEMPPGLIKTVKGYKKLFEFDCPIVVSRFQSLLAAHPNRPLVDSVVEGLKVGFWPGSIETPQIATYDDSWSIVPKSEQEKSLVAFCKQEQRAKRIPSSVGKNLFPGMHAPPRLVISKDGEMRLVTDYSSGKYPPESFCMKEGTFVNTDNFDLFASTLSQASMAAKLGGKPPVLFKLDTSNMYRCLPMHPYWQAQHVVKVGDLYYVNKYNTFATRAEKRIWRIFFSLVLWIAKYNKCIPDLFADANSVFSVDSAMPLVQYAEYDKYLPKKLALLSLFNDLGIPHEEEKHSFGTEIELVGRKINANTSTMKPPDRVYNDLRATVTALKQPTDAASPSLHKPLREVRKFVRLVDEVSEYHKPLRLGTLALQGALKSNGQTLDPDELMPIEEFKHDLLWLEAHLKCWKGAPLCPSKPGNGRILKVYCDASPTGVGFYCPTIERAYHVPMPPSMPSADTTFLEAFAVFCVISWASSEKLTQTELLVFSDNVSAVLMFSEFRASQTNYVRLLQNSVDILTEHEMTLQVQYIDRGNNHMADNLSRKASSVEETSKSLSRDISQRLLPCRVDVFDVSFDVSLKTPAQKPGQTQDDPLKNNKGKESGRPTSGTKSTKSASNPPAQDSPKKAAKGSSATPVTATKKVKKTEQQPSHANLNICRDDPSKGEKSSPKKQKKHSDSQQTAKAAKGKGAGPTS